MNVEMMAVKDIKPFERNAKKHDETQIKNVMESIKQFGFAQPLVVDKDNVLIIGHCRLIASKRLKLDKVPIVRMDELTQEQVDKLRLLDNKLNESEWDFELLAEDVPTLDWDGFDIDWKLPEDTDGTNDAEGEHGNLNDKFIVPPFSILDTRQGYWQDRNFVDYTKKCFNDNGLVTYNEAILIDMLGSAMLRANQTFKSRKLVKVHQNVLVFYKGDIKKIKDNYKEIEVGEISEESFNG